MNKKQNLNRRDFLRVAGLAGLALAAPKVVACREGKEVVSSPDEYGGFYVRRHAVGEPPYTVDDKMFQRADFTDIAAEFMANLEGERQYIRNRNKHIKNNDPGQSRLDYAFCGGAWTLSSSIEGGGMGGSCVLSWSPLEGDLKEWGLYNSRWDPAEAGISQQTLTNIVKKAAKFYGASLAGVAMVDERWFYSGQPFMGHGVRLPIIGAMDFSQIPKGATPEMLRAVMKNARVPIVFDEVEKPAILENGTRVIPKTMKYAIVMAFEMDYEALESEVSAITEAAVANGYSRMVFTTACLSQFLRGLGYHAIPMNNDTALSVPMAIDAGLGELGRNGLVITPKYGPRVRLAKVITDLPLVPDHPISFGVTEFCEACKKCAKHCPGQAISNGSRSYDAIGVGPSGVLKWPIDNRKCHQAWCEYANGCQTCIRVCPFNKPQSWLHEITKNMIGLQKKPIDSLLLNLDDASGYGKGKDPRKFWDKNHYIHTMV